MKGGSLVSRKGPEKERRMGQRRITKCNKEYISKVCTTSHNEEHSHTTADYQQFIMGVLCSPCEF